MTAWLGGWLKDIIMIILLATFIDLLIPNNALQRYVRVVVSLIILLTVLSPVIALFRAETDILRAAETAAVNGELPPLQNLLEEGARMKQEAERESTALVEAEIADMMRADLERMTGLAVDELEVRLAEADADNRPAIGSVRVRLAAIRTGKPDGAATGKEVGDTGRSAVFVEAVRPVDIDVQPAGRANESESDGRQAVARRPYGGMEHRITLYMKETWDVDESRVRLEWSGEVTEHG